MNNFSWVRFILILLAALNLTTFFIFGFDKLIAGGQTRRLPEKILWLFCLLGGSAGGLLGMYIFRHKTRKLSFQLVLAGIFLLQLVLIGAWIYLRKMV